MLFPSLKKRQLIISILITSNDIYMVFTFKKRRVKFLKGQRTFYAQVLTGEITVEDTLGIIRLWLESITEDYLLEILDDSPIKHRPTIKISPRVKVDFNITENDVMFYLQPSS